MSEIKIESGKRYRTRGGSEATVLYRLKNPFLKDFEFVVVRHSENEDMDVYRENGTYRLDGKPSNSDLVEQIGKE